VEIRETKPFGDRASMPGTTVRRRRHNRPKQQVIASPLLTAIAND
jgi:hypothetical protein